MRHVSGKTNKINNYVRPISNKMKTNVIELLLHNIKYLMWRNIMQLKSRVQ
jgi:hypothetical protein